MNLNSKKTAIIAAVAILLFIVLYATGAGEKFGRFVTIMGNIGTNLAHPSHGDPRSLEVVDVTFIKNHTGSTDRINEEELPKALRPIKKHGHLPFTMGACQVCHAPKRSKPAAILTQHVEELCYRCHIPAEKPQLIDCNTCHNPHHADREELLREKVTEQKCPVGHFTE